VSELSRVIMGINTNLSMMDLITTLDVSQPTAPADGKKPGMLGGKENK